MDNVIKIRIGELGCCGGGSAEEVRHDSTCRCEGYHERILRNREFEIITGPYLVTTLTLLERGM